MFSTALLLAALTPAHAQEEVIDDLLLCEVVEVTNGLQNVSYSSFSKKTVITTPNLTYGKAKIEGIATTTVTVSSGGTVSYTVPVSSYVNSFGRDVGSIMLTVTFVDEYWSFGTAYEELGSITTEAYAADAVGPDVSTSVTWGTQHLPEGADHVFVQVSVYFETERGGVCPVFYGHELIPLSHFAAGPGQMTLTNGIGDPTNP